MEAKKNNSSPLEKKENMALRGREEKHLKNFQATPVSQKAEKHFCSPLLLVPFGNGRGVQKELNQRETPRFQVSCQYEEFDFFRSSTIKRHQQKRMLHKGILPATSTTEINSCGSSTESPLSSTPITLEIQTCDSEDELDRGDRKANSPSQMSSDLEAISSNSDTQELFITQLFPNNTVFEGSYQQSPSNLQLSQVSVMKETFENSCLLSSSATRSNWREHFPATQECGVQTDNYFSSLAVASFGIKREAIDCQEQPLDLSLPYRIRSGATNAEIFHSLEGAEHGIPMPLQCKLETSIEVLDDESENVGSQLLKSEDVKYIQLHLNSSYYFKPKGTSDAAVSQTPLVRQRDPNVTVLGTPLERRRKKD